MKYTDNEQIRSIIKMLIFQEKVKITNIAEKMGTSRQNLYKTINNSNLRIDDISKICETFDYELSFNITKKNDKNENSSIADIDRLNNIELQLAELYKEVIQWKNSIGVN